MTDIRCPVCRATNSAGPACRRCKADLSLLWQLEEHRAARLAEANAAATHGYWPAVRLLAGQAQVLRQGDDSARLLALAALLLGDCAEAWELLTQLSAPAPSPP